MTDTEAIMDFAAALGERVLIRGGELWRVDEVLRRIFAAYGLTEESIFMLPHTLSISARQPGQSPVQRQRDVGNIVVDLEELTRLNRLVERVCLFRPQPGQLRELLEQAVAEPGYPAPMTLLGMVCALLSLNFLIGGGPSEAVFVAFGITLVMGSSLFLSPVPGTNSMAVCAVGALLAGAVDLWGYQLGLTSDPYLVMVVTSLGLVPGIPLINACREMLCGRVLCGGLLFMQAFMETLAAACGFAVAIWLVGV